MTSRSRNLYAELLAFLEVPGGARAGRPDRLYAVLSQRGTGPQNAQFVQRLLGQGQPGVTTEASKAIRVAVRIDFDKNRRTRAEAVILLLDDSEEPFRVLSWRDDFDGPD